MVIKDYQDGKLVILSKAFDTRTKFLNFFYFLAFTYGAIAVVYKIVSSDTNNIGSIVFTVLILVAYSIVGYRFLNKTVQTEKLFVNKSILTISKHGFLNQKQDIYQTNSISNFRYLAKPPLPKHPLAGDSFDYLGFQTEQERKILNGYPFSV